MQSPTTITLYGIPNCDTVKKARVWLAEQGIDFIFHDFKKNGLDKATVENWLHYLSLEVLINRKGTTWRALSDQQKASVSDPQAAIALMLTAPSLIKRPVLQIVQGSEQKMSVGFSAAQFQPIFS
jgi:arsenate reductase